MNEAVAWLDGWFNPSFEVVNFFNFSNSSFSLCVYMHVCFLCALPHNFGTISQSLHVNDARSVGMSHDVDVIEFSL